MCRDACRTYGNTERRYCRLDRETTQAAHKLAKIFIIVVQADAGERNHHFKEGIGMWAMPEFTNYATGFAETFDYVLASSPSYDGAMPNETYKVATLLQVLLCDVRRQGRNTWPMAYR
jgi:hypothetical protein